MALRLSKVLLIAVVSRSTFSGFIALALAATKLSIATSSLARLFDGKFLRVVIVLSLYLFIEPSSCAYVCPMSNYLSFIFNALIICLSRVLAIHFNKVLAYVGQSVMVSVLSIKAGVNRDECTPIKPKAIGRRTAD